MKTRKTLETFYRSVYRRENKLKKFFLEIIFNIASYPRLMLEVFLRKNFGERYFNAATAISIGVILTLIPIVINKSGQAAVGTSFGQYFWHFFTTWYLFVGAFSYFSYLRWKEVRRQPSTFDFGKFSLSAGSINSVFYELKIFGKKFNTRQIEIFLEPGFCLLAGFALILVGQLIGVVVFVAAIFYSVSYMGAYYKGDNEILDRIDITIAQQEVKRMMIEDDEKESPRGFRFTFRKPVSLEDREQLLASLYDEYDEEFADVS